MATRKGTQRPTGSPAKPSKRAARTRARAAFIDTLAARADFGPPTRADMTPMFAAKRVKAGALTGAPDKAQTVLYIHGIGNHPEEQVLVVRWDRALFGKDMGDRTRMAYWVNRARHGQPETCECLDPKCKCRDPDQPMTSRRVLSQGTPDPRREVESAVNAMELGDPEADFLRALGGELAENALDEAERQATTAPMRSARSQAVGAKGIGDSLLRGLTNLITGAFLPDVEDFLFEPEARARMEDIFLARLETGGGPFVVIAHSQGSMIAYDVLRQLTKADVDVRLFVTIGSPLGLAPVRSVFKKWTKKKRLPWPDCVSRWLNVAVAGDIVAKDSNLVDDIELGGRNFENVEIGRRQRDANPLFDGNAHSSMGYLSLAEVQTPIVEEVGREFARSLMRSVLTPNLVGAYETVADAARHRVLIEVEDLAGARQDSVAEGRRLLGERLGEFASAAPGQDLEIAHHARFVSARLHRLELETLRTEFENLQIKRVWEDARKRALICRSTHVVQARPANEAYGALGQGIEWAVLDTGIHHRHPHFAMHRNVASIWDCTRPAGRRQRTSDVTEPSGGFVEYDGRGRLRDGKPFESMLDRNGHGTHVAGIIAGEYPDELEEDGELVRFAGMAPKTKLHSFKVLDDQGEGRDSWILTALDKIASINEAAGKLRIHGINLSLGGAFDPSVYGCGHTPLCNELRRLWRQGVLIVLAAGNEGFAVLQTLQDGPWQVNLDLSIGDPANLDEAIAVGSVHRVNPHTFGVSFFSSRGPTADGRQKPDVVAPGEKITSARSDFEEQIKRARPGAKRAMRDLYVAESGTSMAAPHVSGVLAAFLSMRREFIGYPDRVKQTLIESCIDLGRERHSQGAGLVSLVPMLARI